MKTFRVNIKGAWQTVELTDEEVERVEKETIARNVQIMKECIEKTKEMGLVESKIEAAVALFNMQARPTYYILEEYAANKAMEKADKPELKKPEKPKEAPKVDKLIKEEPSQRTFANVCQCGAIVSKRRMDESIAKYGKVVCAFCEEKVEVKR